MSKNIYDIIFSSTKALTYLDDLQTKIYAVSGYKLEQLLDLFKQGYELKPPCYPKSLSEIDFPIEDKNND